VVVVWLVCRCLPSVITICGHIVIGLSLLSSVSKHNMWSYYGRDCRCLSVSIKCGITIGFIVVFVRQQTEYVVVLCLGCRCLPSVNTRCGHIMIGLSLSSVSKHNMWPYYDWVVVVFLSSVRLTDGRQRQPNHNTTTYCAYWRKTTQS
jgi:hypothetical protein